MSLEGANTGVLEHPAQALIQRILDTDINDIDQMIDFVKFCRQYQDQLDENYIKFMINAQRVANAKMPKGVVEIGSEERVDFRVAIIKDYKLHNPEIDMDKIKEKIRNINTALDEALASAPKQSINDVKRNDTDYVAYATGFEVAFEYASPDNYQFPEERSDNPALMDVKDFLNSPTYEMIQAGRPEEATKALQSKYDIIAQHPVHNLIEMLRRTDEKDLDQIIDFAKVSEEFGTQIKNNLMRDFINAKREAEGKEAISEDETIDFGADEYVSLYSSIFLNYVQSADFSKEELEGLFRKLDYMDDQIYKLRGSGVRNVRRSEQTHRSMSDLLASLEDAMQPEPKTLPFESKYVLSKPQELSNIKINIEAYQDNELALEQTDIKILKELEDIKIAKQLGDELAKSISQEIESTETLNTELTSKASRKRMVLSSYSDQRNLAQREVNQYVQNLSENKSHLEQTMKLPEMKDVSHLTTLDDKKAYLKELQEHKEKLLSELEKSSKGVSNAANTCNEQIKDKHLSKSHKTIFGQIIKGAIRSIYTKLNKHFPERFPNPEPDFLKSKTELAVETSKLRIDQTSEDIEKRAPKRTKK